MVQFCSVQSRQCEQAFIATVLRKLVGEPDAVDYVSTSGPSAVIVVVVLLLVVAVGGGVAAFVLVYYRRRRRRGRKPTTPENPVNVEILDQYVFAFK